MDVLLALSIPLTILLWGRWYYFLLHKRPFLFSGPGRMAIALLPALCAVFLLVVLLGWSAKSVKSDFQAVVTYLLVGADWIGLTQLIFGFLGVSARDDVLERRNLAAAWVISGQLVAAAICFAGANVGNGPGPAVVIFCAILSTGALLFLWFIVDRAASISDSVTIDRHLGTGIRACGWLIAAGIVLGDAVTGDWKSASGTLRDFVACAWPVALCGVLVTLLERKMRTLEAGQLWNRKQGSIAFAVAFVVCAFGYAWKRGIY
jgi:hypothetical protein